MSKPIVYYGVARNTDGKLEQVKVIKANSHKRSSQNFTGKIYKTMAEAITDLLATNC